MLKEGYYMSPNEGQEEFEEVQSDLKKKDDEVNHAHTKTCMHIFGLVLCSHKEMYYMIYDMLKSFEYFFRWKRKKW